MSDPVEDEQTILQQIVGKVVDRLTETEALDSKRASDVKKLLLNESSRNAADVIKVLREPDANPGT